MKKILLAISLSIGATSVFANIEEVTTKTVEDIVEMATTVLTVAATELAEEIETTKAAPVEVAEEVKAITTEATDIIECATEETAAE